MSFKEFIKPTWFKVVFAIILLITLIFNEQFSGITPNCNFDLNSIQKIFLLGIPILNFIFFPIIGINWLITGIIYTTLSITITDKTIYPGMIIVGIFFFYFISCSMNWIDTKLKRLGRTRVFLYCLIIFLILVLLYFGPAPGDKYIPNRCQFPAGLDCIDMSETICKSYGADINFYLRNNIGYPIVIRDINIPESINYASCSEKITIWVDTDGNGPRDYQEVRRSDATSYGVINNGDSFSVKLECDNRKSWKGTSVSFDVNLSYFNPETNEEHNANGSIRGRLIDKG